MAPPYGVSSSALSLKKIAVFSKIFSFRFHQEFEAFEG